jgi:glycerol-3-phosphate O-acyltransferase / dihydroxyacetone phosphate acyltransferase
MIYAAVRRLLRLVLRCFYRIEVAGPPLPPQGPLLLVGNHPNALIDPALLIAVSPRPLTLLAKAPLFRMPVLGALVRGLGALPVVRAQDGAAPPGSNASALEAAERGLASGRAVALFPEGRGHSEPALGALKTGAARLALGVGVPVAVVPVGLTYADKERFRSGVHLEFGPPLEVPPAQATPEAVHALTERIAEGLKSLTLNLSSWEDLPLIQAAESLYVLANAAPARDVERERLFARGLALIRAEQPARAAELQTEVLALQRRLALTRAEASDLGLRYRPAGVARFILRNLVAVVVGLPLAAVGVVAFGPPALLLHAVLRWTRTETDMAATVKLLVALVLGPLYVLLLAMAVWKLAGRGWALAWVLAALPLGLFTRRFLARRAEALADARVFFRLGNRSATKRRLQESARALAGRISVLADEIRPRL